LDAFDGLWFRRCSEVAAALQAPVESPDDEQTLEPYLIDVRAAVAALPAAEREALTQYTGEALPAFAHSWAIGFTDAVKARLDDWRAARARAGPSLGRRAGRPRRADRRRHRTACPQPGQR